MNWLVFFTLLGVFSFIFGGFIYLEAAEDNEVGVLVMIVSAFVLCICGAVYF